MKHLLPALVVVALGGLVTAAMAGDYHVGTTLVCSDCHVMHASKQHAAGAGDTTYTYPYAGTPTAKLLRAETVNNVCLGCHDGQTAIPDVFCDNSASAMTPNGRRAGALNAATNAFGINNVAPYAEEDGHSLFSEDLPPGNVGGTGAIGSNAALIGAEGLECTSCHGAHGNKYYRNMNGYRNATPPSYIPAQWQGIEVSYQIGGTPMDTAWVYEALPHNYDDANINYQEPDQTRSAYGEWCGVCHGNFHGAPGSTNIGPSGAEVRHPTAGVDMDSSTTAKWANPTTTNRLKVMSAAGHWTVSGSGTPRPNLASEQFTPSCFTCHKSHGNANPYGLIFVYTNASNGPAANGNAAAHITEEGNGGQYRDMCRNCHGQGTFPSGNPTNIQ
jgi:hypothetical protein